MPCVTKRLPNPQQEVKWSYSSELLCPYDRSNTINFFDIFGISTSDINRNANTLIRYFKKYLNTTKY